MIWDLTWRMNSAPDGMAEKPLTLVGIRFKKCSEVRSGRIRWSIVERTLVWCPLAYGSH